MNKIDPAPGPGSHKKKRALDELNETGQIASSNLIKHASTLRTSDNVVHSPYQKVSIPEVTLPELLWQRVSLWPDHVAVECSVTGRKFTYAEMRSLSRSLGNSLLKNGYKKGDTIAVLLPNVVEYPLIILGVMDAGLTLTPLHPLSSPEEISRQVERSEAPCLITSPSLLNKVNQKTRSSVKVICLSEANKDFGAQVEGVTSFESLIKGDDTTLLKRQDFDRNLNQTTLLMYSSGTTGIPKGVMITQRNIVFQTLSHAVPEIDVVPEATGKCVFQLTFKRNAFWQATVPCIPPLSTIFGLGCIMTRTFFNGAKLVMVPAFRPDLFLPMLDKNKDVVLHIVPTVIRFLATSDNVREENLKNLISTVIGGAKPDSNDIERLLKKKPHIVTIGYGMTEASPGLSHTPVFSTNYTSVGYVISNTVAKVVDPETKKVRGPGETGELCFKGPQVSKGYFKQPEATKDTIDDEGWLHTGDEGHIDESGQCFVTDRIKDLIKVKGYQVAPAELEYVLKQHPCVYEACVTSIPDDRTGEQPVAFVVLKDQNAPKADEIREFVNTKVAPHKRLLTVSFIDSIPTTTSGKFKRRELRKLL